MLRAAAAHSAPPSSTPRLWDPAAGSAPRGPSTGSWHWGRAATKDNCERSVRNRELQSPFFPSLAICSQASTAPGPICCKEGNDLPNLLAAIPRSEEHTSELQSLPTISYAVFC